MTASGPAAGTGGSQTPPLGATTLSKAVAGKTVLVVGDSWAANLGVGMSSVASSTATIVNAGIGGCGIMLPDPSTTNATCSAWPTSWPAYLAEYKPNAVVLTVGFFDVTPQKLPGEAAAHDLSDPAHLAVFQNHLDKAIAILTADKAPLYLMNSALVAKPAYRASALAMNQTLAAAVRTHPGVHLLDVQAQLCNGTGCPRVIDGINVYDPTQHPAPAARDRLADWALDTIFPAQPAS
ncbi:MAG TPA: SGNH hydrolase domain-containing protein [Actinocrinis sp.]|nr:SGNH hydrolase domain-containing protein [Actinocrinis sp.]